MGRISADMIIALINQNLTRVIAELQNSSAEKWWNQVSPMGPLVIQKRYFSDIPFRKQSKIKESKISIYEESLYLCRFAVAECDEPPSFSG